MKTRIITGLIAFLIFIPFVLLGGKYFLFSSFLLGVLSIYEILKITFKKISLLNFISASMLLVVIFFHENLDNKYKYIFIIFSILLLFMEIIITSHKIKLSDVSVILFLTVYVGLGFYSLYLIRNVGLSVLLYLLITIWVTDSGAYFGGMKFGKNKLSPNISPNKSIEGSVIGSLSSIFVAIIFYCFSNIFSNILLATVITVLISVIGQLGDLIESAYKREYKVKDSSNILPGHGGIFDRFDSLILTAPILLILLNVINV